VEAIMLMWLLRLLVASLVLVGPPPVGEPSPEPAPAKSKADLLMEARLKKGLPKEVYEKVKDYKFKFQIVGKHGKSYTIYTTDKLEFEKDGWVKVKSYYAVGWSEYEGKEYRKWWTGREDEKRRFQFDREMKSDIDVKKGGLQIMEATGLHITYQNGAVWRVRLGEDGKLPLDTMFME
jgi:hypothetical protein